MLTALLALTVTAASGPLPLAAPGFSLSGVDAAQGEAYLSYLAELLEKEGDFRVTTGQQIAAAMGLERQRELLGCAANADSCTAEMAGALGVSGLLIGSVARVGPELVVNVRVIDARTTHTLASATRRASSEAKVLDALRALEPDLAQDVRRAFGRPLKAIDSGRRWAWAPAIGGPVVAALGGAAVFVAHQDARALRGGAADVGSREELDQRIGKDSTLQTAGWIGIGLGLVSGAVGTYLLASDPTSQGRLEVSGTPSGLFVAWGGRWR